ncbi:DUF7230 family protein [Crenobacter cavernae]|uniref:DUF7230 family protein n=1 Tax=Crenobacter cavernae TaxID=2290923 RepID=UPI00141A3449|nr:hypothetical protein [Crenobacter cavernae]
MSKRLKPVAKFARHFNRCAAYVDRKKRQGVIKHKKREVFRLPLFAAAGPNSRRR